PGQISRFPFPLYIDEGLRPWSPFPRLLIRKTIDNQGLYAFLNHHGPGDNVLLGPTWTMNQKYPEEQGQWKDWFYGDMGGSRAFHMVCFGSDPPGPNCNWISRGPDIL